MRAPQLLMMGLIRIYQWIFSPIKNAFLGSGGCCRFSPTCSCYAHEALRVHGVWRGSRLAVRRMLRCHPWGGAGDDPVPESDHR